MSDGLEDRAAGAEGEDFCEDAGARGGKIESMEAADIVTFAHRDWGRLADLKAEYWARLRAEHGPGGAILIGDQLRRQALRQHPAWPTEDDRRLDLESHIRVSAAFRSVASTRRL